MTTTTTTDLDRQLTALAVGLNEGSVSIDELLKRVLPATSAFAGEPRLPEKISLTKAEKDAIQKFVKHYGDVVPESRRKLTPEEAAQIIELRAVAKIVSDVSERAIERVRSLTCMHLDVEAEEEGRVSDDCVRDKSGHYVLDGEINAPGVDKRLSREVREQAARVDVEKLQDAENDPEFADFYTHDDFLSMTRQVREFDPHAFALALRKKPELIRVVHKVGTRGTRTASVYLRPRR